MFLTSALLTLPAPPGLLWAWAVMLLQVWQMPTGVTLLLD